MSAIFSKRYEKNPPLMVMAAFKRHLQRSLGLPESHWELGFKLQRIGQRSGPFLEERGKGDACVA